VLSSTESKALLAAFRIPVARSVVARDEVEAARLAAEIGFPVAMKIDSPDITHKSDVGGVKLSLRDADAVRAAYREMTRRVARVRPDARVSGVSLEAMVPRTTARELMAGIVNDPIFGPAITFGAGGVAIEILHDRVVALPPLNKALVQDMIRGTRVAKMLGDFRNLPAVDREALDAVLLRVSEIACEMPEIDELDVNPLIASEDGVVAVDARIVLREALTARRPYGHLAIHPYPAELAGTLTLRDGTTVGLRPIRPEDAAIETEFVQRLSDESRRLRFLSGIRSLTPSMLARFTQIDYDREMALVAVTEENGREREVGVCRYITLPDAASCEFAIVVADDWQKRGLGPRMMRALIDVANRRGLSTMIGWIAADNSGMLRMVANLGFVIAMDPEDSTTRSATLDLAATGKPALASSSA
jgi:acetyltransferase